MTREAETMQTSMFRSIGRFFQGAGQALSTPMGDARGRLSVPLDTMFDVATADRFVGR